MNLNPGYIESAGCLIFTWPIEYLMIEMLTGMMSILVLTCNGVVRVPGGMVPPAQRRPTTHFFPHKPILGPNEDT